jgi:hypothetical protein
MQAGFELVQEMRRTVFELLAADGVVVDGVVTKNLLTSHAMARLVSGFSGDDQVRAAALVGAFLPMVLDWTKREAKAKGIGYKVALRAMAKL